MCVSFLPPKKNSEGFIFRNVCVNSCVVMSHLESGIELGGALLLPRFILRCWGSPVFNVGGF